MIVRVGDPTISCLNIGSKDKFRADIRIFAGYPVFSKCVHLCYENSGTNSFEGGEECKDPHEQIGFWPRKIPLDQFGVGSTRIKIKIEPVN